MNFRVYVLSILILLSSCKPNAGIEENLALQEKPQRDSTERITFEYEDIPSSLLHGSIHGGVDIFMDDDDTLHIVALKRIVDVDLGSYPYVLGYWTRSQARWTYQILQVSLNRFYKTSFNEYYDYEQNFIRINSDNGTLIATYLNHQARLVQVNLNDQIITESAFACDIFQTLQKNNDTFEIECLLNDNTQLLRRTLSANMVQTAFNQYAGTRATNSKFEVGMSTNGENKVFLRAYQNNNVEKNLIQLSGPETTILQRNIGVWGHIALIRDAEELKLCADDKIYTINDFVATVQNKRFNTSADAKMLTSCTFTKLDQVVSFRGSYPNLQIYIHEGQYKLFDIKNFRAIHSYQISQFENAFIGYQNNRIKILMMRRSKNY